MKAFSRRACVKKLGLAAATFPAALLPISVFAAETGPEIKPAEGEQTEINEIARRFMERFSVPGLSLAIARHGKIVHQQGFGYADKAAGTAVTPAHLFRIASVTKPLTATAVFSLIEQQRLGLDDLVFGEQGRLKFDFGKNHPGAIRDISVRHLLTHTCGGWANNRNDPMFLHPSMGHKELIEWTLQHQPLPDAPGVSYAYSNFGYCLLGRIVEKITGQPYAQMVQQEVLTKCGIQGMRIAGNTAADRAKDEVTYYGEPDGAPYKMNVARMDSHGGWIATATDLALFAIHVDGFSTSPNILKAGTIATMTTPGAVNPGYACGWSVNKQGNWWHGGSLPGTSAIMVRSAKGLCWAALTNARSEGISPALDRMMWQIVGAVPAWQA